jgi:hypothetical protein
MKRADVFLDTIGFSGFNTVMQAVDCGLPVVTREGRFMRGRLGSAILDRMGLSDLVAKTENEYIDLAVKLAGDPHYGTKFGNVWGRRTRSSITISSRFGHWRTFSSKQWQIRLNVKPDSEYDRSRWVTDRFAQCGTIFHVGACNPFCGGKLNSGARCKMRCEEDSCCKNC